MNFWVGKGTFNTPKILSVVHHKHIRHSGTGVVATEHEGNKEGEKIKRIRLSTDGAAEKNMFRSL